MHVRKQTRTHTHTRTYTHTLTRAHTLTRMHTHTLSNNYFRRISMWCWEWCVCVYTRLWHPAQYLPTPSALLPLPHRPHLLSFGGTPFFIFHFYAACPICPFLLYLLASSNGVVVGGVYLSSNFIPNLHFGIGSHRISELSKE